MLADKIVTDDSVQTLAILAKYLIVCTAAICFSIAGFAWNTNTAIKENANQIGGMIDQFERHREDSMRRLDRLEEELLYNN